MADTKNDMQTTMASMLETVENEDMQGLSIDDLKRAMSHPKAAETIAALLPYEATSVRPGQPAPDFTLPYLPESGPAGDRQSGREDDAASFTLSHHFGKRPVALIFGSYT